MIRRVMSAIAALSLTILIILGVPSPAQSDQLDMRQSQQQPQSYQQEQYPQQTQSFQQQMPQQSQSLQANQSFQDKASSFINDFVNQVSGKKGEKAASTVQQEQTSPQNTAS